MTDHMCKKMSVGVILGGHPWIRTFCSDCGLEMAESRPVVTIQPGDAGYRFTR